MAGTMEGKSVPTTDDIRQAVTRELIAYLSAQSYFKRLTRVPAPAELDGAVKLRDLRLDYRDHYALGVHLARRGHCQRLATWQTARWVTVADVVTTVIRYPVPIPERSSNPSRY